MEGWGSPGLPACHPANGGWLPFARSNESDEGGDRLDSVVLLLPGARVTGGLPGVDDGRSVRCLSSAGLVGGGGDEPATRFGADSEGRVSLGSAEVVALSERDSV